MKSTFLLLCVAASVALFATTASKSEEQHKAASPDADSMIGKEAGQVRADNGLKMKLVWCPPGKFTMGSPDTEARRGDGEDQVSVTLQKGFWMGKYEVTQTEYERLIGQNPSSFSRQGKAKDDVSGQNTEQFPVDRTSWDDAIEFSRKLTDQERKSGRLPTGWGYTLPTESQWEYACRAETTTVFSFGNQLNGREANCDGTHPYGTDSNGPYLKRTTRVGSYRGNNWGLCDMHGNVYEWCQDWYGTKLLGGNDPAGPSAGSSRVIRGGGWFDVAVTCRSAYRNRYSPSLRRGDIGFRVVLSP